MSQIQEITKRIVVADANVYVPLSIFPRGSINKINVVKVGGGSFTVDVYNRAFAQAAINIVNITNDGNNKAKIELASEHLAKVGDTLTVASSGVGGYNTAHTVESIVNEFTVVTDQNFVSNVRAAGTATRTVPSASFPIYEVVPQLSGTATIRWPTAAVPTDVRYFENQDVLTKVSCRRNTYLYLKFSATGTYYLSIAGESDVG